jgi:hypothetical protein
MTRKAMRTVDTVTKDRWRIRRWMVKKHRLREIP